MDGTGTAGRDRHMDSVRVGQSLVGKFARFSRRCGVRPAETWSVASASTDRFGNDRGGARGGAPHRSRGWRRPGQIGGHSSWDTATDVVLVGRSSQSHPADCLSESGQSVAARNAMREQELAMRAALGAGRKTLLRQLLVEATLISLIGAAAGLGVAQIAVSTFREIYSTNLPQLVSLQIDWRVVTFTLFLCLLTTLFFGLVPALKATRLDLIEVLKQGSRTGSSSRSTQRIRNLLVVTEMGMSLMLILLASLLIQSIARLERQSLGIRPEHLLKAHFYMPPAR